MLPRRQSGLLPKEGRADRIDNCTEAQEETLSQPLVLVSDSRESCIPRAVGILKLGVAENQGQKPPRALDREGTEEHGRSGPGVAGHGDSFWE